MSELLPPQSQPARARWFARGIANIAAIATVAVLAGSCASEKKPNDDPRLLVIDGIEITFADLQPYFEWLKSFRPALGVKTTYIWALRDHVLPLKIAQREFPEERAKQLELAEGLCSVADNIYDLEKESKLIEHKTRSNLTRQSAMLPVAKWLFEMTAIEGKNIPINTNAASQPIELAQGYFVVGSYDFFDSPMVMTEYVDALQVGFVTHTSIAWRKWYENEQLTLGKKVTFVHPDYRDNLPHWMELPKNKKP
ncbi:MAG: hypothetical protein ACI89X_002268 [Planctomycetota bacterium]